MALETRSQIWDGAGRVANEDLGWIALFDHRASLSEPATMRRDQA